MIEQKKIKMELEGYDYVKRKAGESGNSACVYVPKAWRGKEVACVLLEPEEEPKDERT